ncbi:MAG: oligosaccharide flippase family protein, partial [Bacteroidaceae bacterium]|nr:oligosaccharide flippase family protein [Bacteroidaceae bacterium]
MSQPGIKEKTAKGFLWAAVNNGGQQLLNLIFGIFLARLLTPSDYGMVGMLSIFALIATSLQESGFMSALCRKKDITQADFNAVFWFNVLCASAVYALLFACAPLIAAFFKEPVLTPLARLSFLSFVISSFGTTPRAKLFRELKVKETAGITFTALAVSGITGITLAWNGFSYWGIALQNLTYCFCMSAGSWIVSGWRPSLNLNLRPLRGMIGFSSRLLLTNIFTHVNNNLFSVFFGRLYGD